jgi:perosamine synthetase
VIFVHLYGNPSGVVEVNNFCRNNNMYLIEDCAEAIGSFAQNTHVGNFGHISTYSFFGNKTITTGEGGMICFESRELKEKASVLRDHGMSKQRRYWHSVVGYNYRMTNLQAALGLAQMERLANFVERKIANQKIYEKILPKEYFSFTHVNSDCVNSHWFIFINLINYVENTTEKIQEVLYKNNIESRRAFYCLSEMKIYRQYTKSDKTNYRNSRALSVSGLCLPSGVGLTEDKINYVCSILQLANQNMA